MRIIAVVFFVLAGAGLASGQQQWTAQKIEPALAEGIFAEKGKPADEGIPDGLIAEYSGKGDIEAAWYSQPTTRYKHAILGDGIEAGMLKVRDARQRILSIRLPKDQVFEDRTPRLFDLDEDGTVEVITILSSANRGASIAIYGIKGGVLVKKKQNPFIGRSNRWLNIAGIGKFFGVRGNEILYVETPHIGGKLYVLKYHKGDLYQQRLDNDYSNHVIGSREMRLSATADVNGDGRLDIAIPSADRRTLRIMGFSKNALKQLGSVALPSPVNKAIGTKTINGKKGFVTGLENGDVFHVTQ